MSYEDLKLEWQPQYVTDQEATPLLDELKAKGVTIVEPDIAAFWEASEPLCEKVLETEPLAGDVRGADGRAIGLASGPCLSWPAPGTRKLQRRRTDDGQRAGRARMDGLSAARRGLFVKRRQRAILNMESLRVAAPHDGGQPRTAIQGCANSSPGRDRLTAAQWAENARDDMEQLRITLAGTDFEARLETGKAPQTCAAFLQHLPLHSQAIHVRWSGEAVWIPLGDTRFGVGYENATSYPAPGEVILYPGGVSETEILLAYGRVNFASMAGQLAGNHFLTITSNLDRLPDLGRLTLWQGAQDITLDRA